jgi:hypothetical protein
VKRRRRRRRADRAGRTTRQCRVRRGSEEGGSKSSRLGGRTPWTHIQTLLSDTATTGQLQKSQLDWHRTDFPLFSFLLSLFVSSSFSLVAIRCFVLLTVLECEHSRFSSLKFMRGRGEKEQASLLFVAVLSLARVGGQSSILERRRCKNSKRAERVATKADVCERKRSCSLSFDQQAFTTAVLLPARCSITVEARETELVSIQRRRLC